MMTYEIRKIGPMGTKIVETLNDEQEAVKRVLGFIGLEFGPEAFIFYEEDDQNPGCYDFVGAKNMADVQYSIEKKGA